MLAFSVDGITSFSAKPLRWIFMIGLGLLVTDIAVAVYVLCSYFGGDTISGWSSIMLSIWFLGSLILMAIGVVGEYVGKVFTEVKAALDSTYGKLYETPHKIKLRTKGFM